MNLFARTSVSVLIISFFFSIIPTQSKIEAAWREPVRANHAIVASQHELASKIGADIMKRGGNAVDAAIAVGLALAVVYPEAGNLGGGGFMLMRFKDGRTAAIDYREMAPKAANRDIYLDKNGEVIKGEGSSTHRLSRVGRSGNSGWFRLCF